MQAAYVVNNFKKTLSKKTKIAILLFSILIITGFSLRGKISGEKFDSEKWKNWENTEEEWSLRWDMMNSLRNNYKLIGMSRTEIINLLGQPNNEFSSSNSFRYFLGFAKSGIDTGSLIIEFEKNRHPSKKEIDF